MHLALGNFPKVIATMLELRIVPYTRPKFKESVRMYCVISAGMPMCPAFPGQFPRGRPGGAGQLVPSSRPDMHTQPGHGGRRQSRIPRLISQCSGPALTDRTAPPGAPEERRHPLPLRDVGGGGSRTVQERGSRETWEHLAAEGAGRENRQPGAMPWPTA